MKKLFVYFAVIAVMLFMISCGGGSSKNEVGALGGECYGNKSCNDGLICDKERNLCIEDSQYPTDDSDTIPDNNDSSDTDNTYSSDTDSLDSDAPEHICKPNPCKNISNSTDNCSINYWTSNYYVCGCKNGYVFDGASCIKNSSKLPECSPESTNPCIDAETGLIWSAKSENKMEWSDAVDYCKNLNEGEYNDWYIPSVAVLRTLLNCTKAYENQCASIKSDGSNSKFGEIIPLWSKGTDGKKSYGIDFLDGSKFEKKLEENFLTYARCVRKDFSDSHEAQCSALPDNASWSSNTITQTWDWDTMWTPRAIASLESGCVFGCNTSYHVSNTNNKCVSPCDPNPCEGLSHSTGECIVEDIYEYKCNCESGWESHEHICIAASSHQIDGITWSSKSQSPMSLDEALNYCKNLNEGGYSDWHLPTISELRSLIQNCENSAIGSSCAVDDSCLYLDCWSDACGGCLFCPPKFGHPLKRGGKMGVNHYPLELREQVLTEYEFGLGGYRTLAKKHGLKRDTVRD